MTTVTTEQATETYKRTVRDDHRHTWANWVLAVHNSLAAGDWIGGTGYPAFAKEVYEVVKSEQKISMADSN